jgi:hypothetical protein
MNYINHEEGRTAREFAKYRSPLELPGGTTHTLLYIKSVCYYYYKLGSSICLPPTQLALAQERHLNTPVESTKLKDLSETYLVLYSSSSRLPFRSSLPNPHLALQCFLMESCYSKNPTPPQAPEIRL